MSILVKEFQEFPINSEMQIKHAKFKMEKTCKLFFLYFRQKLYLCTWSFLRWIARNWILLLPNWWDKTVKKINRWNNIFTWDFETIDHVFQDSTRKHINKFANHFWCPILWNAIIYFLKLILSSHSTTR